MRRHRPTTLGSPIRIALICAARVSVLAAGAPLMALGQVPSDSAQPTFHLLGSVFDRQTEAPLPAARVYLLDAASRVRITWADTDTLGIFELPPVAGGRYNVRVERIGYESVEDSISLGEGEDRALTVYMVPDAIDLEPLIVRVPRTAAYYMRDFDRRRATGSGAFITRAQIDRRPVTLTSELLQRLGGMRVIYGRRGDASLRLRGGCQPHIYMDGMAVNPGVPIDMLVVPDQIEGVEIYSTAAIPPQYGSMGACGVILIWTRVPVQVEGKKIALWKHLVAVGVLLALLLKN